MKLQPVTGKPFVTMCRKCWKRFTFGTSTDPAAHPIGGYADLDGKPFEAYYCNACAAELQHGTSAERLLEALDHAYDVLNTAQSALAETAPNGRDYYVQAAGNMEKAQAQHFERMKKLQNVQRELQAIVDAIQEQVWAREKLQGKR